MTVHVYKFVHVWDKVGTYQNDTCRFWNIFAIIDFIKLLFFGY